MSMTSNDGSSRADGRDKHGSGDAPDKTCEAIVTLWFVDAPSVTEAVRTGRHADRGFGRKYLAQLNPSWPLTCIGQFRLNHSVPASVDEYYIAGYPGVTMVQTVVGDVTEISQLDKRLVESLPARNVFGFAINRDTGFGAFAHWAGSADKLCRAFSASRNRIYEDVGLPEPFESPFWAGQREPSYAHHRLDLPFDPIELAHEASRSWLDFDPNRGPDVEVIAFATDGRPEPHLGRGPKLSRDLESLVESSAKKLGLSPDRGFDDYEDDSGDDTNDDIKALARSVGQLVTDGARQLRLSARRAARKVRRIRRGR